MKRIKITNHLDSQVVAFCNSLFDSRKSTGKKPFIRPKKKLENLIASFTIGSAEYNYIEKIQNEYDKLLYIKPSAFKKKINPTLSTLKIYKKRRRLAIDGYLLLIFVLTILVTNLIKIPLSN